MYRELLGGFLMSIVLFSHTGIATAQTDKRLGAIPVGPEKHGFEWLGYGYKAYEFYADTRSIRSDNPIFNMNNVKANYQEINFTMERSAEGATKS